MDKTAADTLNARFDAMTARQHKILDEVHAIAIDVARINTSLARSTRAH